MNEKTVPITEYCKKCNEEINEDNPISECANCAKEICYECSNEWKSLELCSGCFYSLSEEES